MKVMVHESCAPAEELMRAVLRDGEPIAPEYPLVFDERFEGRLVATAESQGGVLSACAILPRELILPQARFRAGLIGSVATDPAHRRRGLAAETLDAAERELAARGCVLTLLWADEGSFYRNRGYVPVGTELDFLVTSDLAPLLPDPDGVRAMRPEDARVIHDLYATHPARVDRSAAETEALLAGPGIECLVLEHEGGPLAYSCLGRGADLQNAVHEWAGQAEDVLACLRGHLERREGDGPVFIMVPPTATGMCSYFELVRAPGVRGVLGMGKLADVEAARDLMQGVVGAAGRVTALTGESAGLRVEGPRGACELVGAEVLLALFAAKGERDVVGVVAGETGLELSDLPLTPFVWGLDSI